jgi:hypothetical protein
MTGELHSIADRIYRRIQGIRPLTPNLFPEATVVSSHAVSSTRAPQPEKWGMRLVLILAACLLCFLFFKLHLYWLLNNLGARIGGAG